MDLVGPGVESVLDIGCRDKALATFLPAGTRYVGMDLFPPADVVANAEEPLPFDDNSFHTVVLADVLEHLDDPHGALDEAMRVGNGAVVVLLPNVYSLWLRVRFARGSTFGKYSFGPENKRDRHRWLMNFDQASQFTRSQAQKANWRVAREYGYDGGFSRRLARVAYWGARMVGTPNLWAWEYAARLEPAPLPQSSPNGSSSRSDAARAEPQRTAKGRRR
jgi:SAM-dependent methyltransferase